MSTKRRLNHLQVCLEALQHRVRAISDLAQSNESTRKLGIELKNQYLVLYVLFHYLTSDCNKKFPKLQTVFQACAEMPQLTADLSTQLANFEPTPDNQAQLMRTSSRATECLNTAKEAVTSHPDYGNRDKSSQSSPPVSPRDKAKVKGRTKHATTSKSPLPVLADVRQLPGLRQKILTFFEDLKEKKTWEGSFVDQQVKIFKDLIQATLALQLGEIFSEKLKSGLQVAVQAVEIFFEAGPGGNIDGLMQPIFKALDSVHDRFMAQKDIFLVQPDTPPGTPKPRASTSMGAALPPLSEPPKDPRSHVVEEICSTEAAYLVFLKQLFLNYRDPLLQAATSPNPIITESQVTEIFGNLGPIIAINTKFLQSLSTACNSAKWESPNIGACFTELLPEFSIYCQYTIQLASAQALLSKLTKKNKNFSAFLKRNANDPSACVDGNEDLELQATLIMPLQRVMRYVLLLRSLDDCTPDAHPDKKFIQEALTMSMALASEINEAVAEESQAKKKKSKKKNKGSDADKEKPEKEPERPGFDYSEAFKKVKLESSSKKQIRRDKKKSTISLDSRPDTASFSFSRDDPTEARTFESVTSELEERPRLERAESTVSTSPPSPAANWTLSSSNQSRGRLMSVSALADSTGGERRGNWASHRQARTEGGASDGLERSTSWLGSDRKRPLSIDPAASQSTASPEPKRSIGTAPAGFQRAAIPSPRLPSIPNLDIPPAPTPATSEPISGGRDGKTADSAPSSPPDSPHVSDVPSIPDLPAEPGKFLAPPADPSADDSNQSESPSERPKSDHFSKMRTKSIAVLGHGLGFGGATIQMPVLPNLNDIPPDKQQRREALLQFSDGEDSKKKKDSFLPSPRGKADYKLPPLKLLVFGLTKAEAPANHSNLDLLEGQAHVKLWKGYSKETLKITGVMCHDEDAIKSCTSQWNTQKFDKAHFDSTDIIMMFGHTNERFQWILDVVAEDKGNTPLVLQHPLLLTLNDAKRASTLIGHVGVIKWMEFVRSVPAFVHQMDSYTKGNIGSINLLSGTYTCIDTGEDKQAQINSALSQLVCLASAFLGNISEVHAYSKQRDSVTTFIVNIISSQDDIAQLTLNFTTSTTLTKASTLDRDREQANKPLQPVSAAGLRNEHPCSQCKIVGTKGTTTATYPENIYTEQLIGQSKPKTSELGQFDQTFFTQLIRDIYSKSEVPYFTDLFQHVKTFIVVESIHRSCSSQQSITTLEVKKDIFKTPH